MGETHLGWKPAVLPLALVTMSLQPATVQRSLLPGFQAGLLSGQGYLTTKLAGALPKAVAPRAGGVVCVNSISSRVAANTAEPLHMVPTLPLNFIEVNLVPPTKAAFPIVPMLRLTVILSKLAQLLNALALIFNEEVQSSITTSFIHACDKNAWVLIVVIPSPMITFHRVVVVSMPALFNVPIAEPFPIVPAVAPKFDSSPGTSATFILLPFTSM